MDNKYRHHNRHNNYNKPSFTGKYKFLEKWLQFSSFGQFLEEVNIIPFKCPLQRAFDTQLSRKERFYFEHVYDYSIAMERPITDVIDLTDTYRYYDPQVDDFFPSSVTHHKIRIPGKNIPSEQDLEDILNKIEALVNSGKVIGVHCTHGVNRTGFIICMFLVKRLGWHPAEAIIAFQKARGEEMSHSDYIEAVLALEEQVVDTRVLSDLDNQELPGKEAIRNDSSASCSTHDEEKAKELPQCF